MATGAAFEEAVAVAGQHPDLSVGVHLALVEGVPVLPPEEVPSLVGADGRFPASLGAFLVRWLTGRIRPVEAQREFEAQVKKVLDHGVEIDKLDSHMHVHVLPGILEPVLAVARRHRIRAIRFPVEQILQRGERPGVGGLARRVALSALAAVQARRIAETGLWRPHHFAGIAESGRLTEGDLLRILRGLKLGVTEIMVHPGYRDAVLNGWPQSRRYRRETELEALLSPRVRQLVAELGIKLTTVREICRNG
jgi:predicted glycoside hydrolase/deacetylase ChbG (UPF0249 family)